MERNIEQDLEKLAKAFFNRLIIDRKHGFGISGLVISALCGSGNIEQDILKIIGHPPTPKSMYFGDGDWGEEEHEYARDLYYKELVPFLQRKYGDRE